MYTRCSECRTLFRVTRAQLNAARGQVKCGHCGTVFDALANLREEVSLPGDDEQALRTNFPLAPESEPASPIVDEDLVEAVVSEDYADLLTPPRTDLGPRWPWWTAAVLLVLIGSAQVVHMQRDALLEHPVIYPYLSKVYDIIGFRVQRDPQYDLRAFLLLHHELVTHPRSGDALHLSGVLYNAADFAQPWPILELRLEDRFGDMVAARRLDPDEYLRNAPEVGELMPAGARRAIEIAFVDPGTDAVGFAIEFCLMLSDGLRCASSPETP
jgi:predicted Zn finger-like uncharacterized protein